MTFNHGVEGSSPSALTKLSLQNKHFLDHRPVRDLRWLAISAPWLAISVLPAFQMLMAGTRTRQSLWASKGSESAPQDVGERCAGLQLR